MPGFNKSMKNSKLLKYIRILICVAFAMLIMLTGCSKTGTNEDVEDTGNTNIITSADSNKDDRADTGVNNPSGEVLTDSEREQFSTSDVLPNDSSFSTRFIDVGQADSALVECDGHYMLIDGGNVDDSSKIFTILKNSGIDKLDIVVGTHAHEDHIGGLSGALNYATADLVLCNVEDYSTKAFSSFKKYAELNGGGIVVPSVGDIYSLGSATVEILLCSSEYSNDSVVLVVRYGGNSFLFTGDMERESEIELCEQYSDEYLIDLLKVGHHGSDTSSSYRFIRMLMPEYAVISVGENNNYGHPTDAVLSRLSDADVKTYRTDLNGDIYVYSDGKNITIETAKEAYESEIFKPADVINNDKNTEVSNGEAQAYVLNTKSMKFHYPSCSGLPTKNRADTTATRDELIAQGYSPCGICKP